jgi:uncharacterized membrane protein
MEESTNVSLSTSPETSFEFIPIKKEALLILKKLFLPAFLVSLILSILGISDGTLNSSINFSALDYNNILSQLSIYKLYQLIKTKLYIFIVAEPLNGFLLIIVIAILFVIVKTLLLNPIELGGRKFFSTLARERKSSISSLLFGFSNNYIFNVRRLFRRDLFIFLSLVASYLLSFVLYSVFGTFILAIANISSSFIFVGPFFMVLSVLAMLPFLNAFYNYKWVPYIIAEDSGLSSIEAMNLSKQMMHGYKLKTFLFDLTYLVWYILFSLTFGLGIFLVHPYANVSKAVLYERMRARSVELTLADSWELGYEYDPFESENMAI